MYQIVLFLSKKAHFLLGGTMNYRIFSYKTQAIIAGFLLSGLSLATIAQSTPATNSVYLSVKRLAPKGGSKATGSRLFNDYDVLEVVVENNSDAAVAVTGVNLPLAEPKQVAKKYKFNSTLGIVIGIVIPIITWPILALVWSGKNSSVKREFKRRATDFSKPLFVKAHAAVSKILYVRREQATNDVQFTVSVNNEQQTVATSIQ